MFQNNWAGDHSGAVWLKVEVDQLGIVTGRPMIDPSPGLRPLTLPVMSF